LFRITGGTNWQFAKVGTTNERTNSHSNLLWCLTLKVSLATVSRFKIRVTRASSGYTGSGRIKDTNIKVTVAIDKAVRANGTIANFATSKTSGGIGKTLLAILGITTE
jgi:hypothetical protein